MTGESCSTQKVNSSGVRSVHKERVAGFLRFLAGYKLSDARINSDVCAAKIRRFLARRKLFDAKINCNEDSWSKVNCSVGSS